jgi:uncharacterized protein YndB with AHSA1/START domain
MPTVEKITVSVIVDASPSRAWDAFTSPYSVVQWNFASDDWCCPKATNDLRMDGSFNYRMESTNGKVGFDFCGTYTNVIPEKRIDYVLGDDREVSIEFRAIGKQTEVVETFDAETENSLDLQRTGWQAILNNYKKHVESNPDRQ